MRTVPIRVHGTLDYFVALLLLGSSFVLSYPDSPMQHISLGFGGITLLYSLMTDYPLAVLRFIPFPIHRTADLLVGGGLAFAPIHFAAHGLPAVLFVVLGGCLIVLAFFTRGQFSPSGRDNPVIPGG